MSPAPFVPTSNHSHSFQRLIRCSPSPSISIVATPFHPPNHQNKQKANLIAMHPPSLTQALTMGLLAASATTATGFGAPNPNTNTQALALRYAVSKPLQAFFALLPSHPIPPSLSLLTSLGSGPHCTTPLQDKTF